MKQKIIKLTESDIHEIVKEAVEDVLRNGLSPKYNVGDYIYVVTPPDEIPTTCQISKVDYDNELGYIYRTKYGWVDERYIRFKYNVKIGENGKKILTPPNYRPN